jgi:hypothetical protein
VTYPVVNFNLRAEKRSLRFFVVLCLAILSSEVKLSGKEPFALGSFELDLASVETPADLPLGELRPDRLFSIDIKLRNSLGEDVTLSGFESDCSCAAAVIQEGGEHAWGQGDVVDVRLRLSTSDLHLGDFSKRIQLFQGTESKKLLGSIRIHGTVKLPMDVTPTSVRLAKGETEVKVPIKVRRLENDVSLLESEAIVRGDWVEIFDITHRAEDELQGEAIVRLPKDVGDEERINATLRLTYTDKYGTNSREQFIEIIRHPPLRVRPRSIVPQTSEEHLVASFLIAGDFRKGEKYDIAFQLTRPIKVGDSVIQSTVYEKTGAAEAFNENLIPVRLRVPIATEEIREATKLVITTNGETVSCVWIPE